MSEITNIDDVDVEITTDMEDIQAAIDNGIFDGGSRFTWRNRTREKSIEKYRVYIDEREEAPEGVTVEEGPEGGLYYEVGRVTDENREHQHPTETFDSPEYLTMDKVVDEKPMGDREKMDEENIAVGTSADKMSVGELESGERVFIEDYSEERRYRTEKKVQAQETAFHCMEALDVKSPMLNFDEDEQKLIQESVGDESTVARKQEVDEDDINEYSHLRAVASKMLIGDMDIAGNVLIDKQGNFYPIDMEFAGRKLDNRKEKLDGDSSSHHDSFEDKIKMSLRSTASRDMRLEMDELKTTTQRLAESVDEESIRERFEGMEGLNDDIIESFIHNLEVVQNDEFWEQ